MRPTSTSQHQSPLTPPAPGGTLQALAAALLPLPAQPRGPRGRTHAAPVPRTARQPCWWLTANTQGRYQALLWGHTAESPAPLRERSGQRQRRLPGPRPAPASRPTATTAAIAPGTGQQAQAGPRPPRQPPPPSQAGRAPVVTELRPKRLLSNFISHRQRFVYFTVSWSTYLVICFLQRSAVFISSYQSSISLMFHGVEVCFNYWYKHYF